MRGTGSSHTSMMAGRRTRRGPAAGRHRRSRAQFPPAPRAGRCLRILLLGAAVLRCVRPLRTVVLATRRECRPRQGRTPSSLAPIMSIMSTRVAAAPLLTDRVLSQWLRSGRRTPGRRLATGARQGCRNSRKSPGGRRVEGNRLEVRREDPVQDVAAVVAQLAHENLLHGARVSPVRQARQRLGVRTGSGGSLG